MARLGFYLPYSHSDPTGSFENAHQFGLAIVPIVQAMSDARVVEIVVYLKVKFRDAPPGGPASNVTRRALLFYHDGSHYEAVTIVSPDAAIFESTGEYAGIRVDMTNAAVRAWADVTENGIFELRTKDNLIIGPNLIIGGLVT